MKQLQTELSKKNAEIEQLQSMLASGVVSRGSSGPRSQAGMSRGAGNSRSTAVNKVGVLVLENFILNDCTVNSV